MRNERAEQRCQTSDEWLDRAEYVSERMIVREPAWRGQRVVSDGEMTGEGEVRGGKYGGRAEKMGGGGGGGDWRLEAGSAAA